MIPKDKMIAEALWHIDAEAEKVGWDINAALFVVDLRPLGDAVGAIELTPLPGWDLCLEKTDNPREAVKAMVKAYSFIPKELRRTQFDRNSLYGVALITEAWMLRGDEAKLLAKQHRIHESPNRVEVRIIYCVSVDGTASALAHERDGIVDEFSDSDGNIRDLLSALVKEISA